MGRSRDERRVKQWGRRKEKQGAGIKNAGWEKNSMNQFCKDYGLVKAEVYHSYLNYENQKFGK